MLEPFIQDVDFTLHVGDVREVLAGLPDESVHCCVTSPPYWGLRDYRTAAWDGGDDGCDHIQTLNLKRNTSGGMLPAGEGTRGTQSSTASSAIGYRDVCGKCGATRIDQQLGLEATPSEYVTRIVEVFREVRRVLRSDGTCWLNLGDSYASGKPGSPSEQSQGIQTLRGPRTRGGKGQDEASGLHAHLQGTAVRPGVPVGFKPKDLVGIPWRVAFALQADGWWLRSDIIWAKPNPMPESVTDRPTKAHEYLFLLTKSARYFYDADAIREDSVGPDRGPGMTRGVNGPHVQLGDRPRRTTSLTPARQTPLVPNQTKQGVGTQGVGSETFGHWPVDGARNARSVWEIPTQAYAEAHFATFPQELPRRCIAAGCPERVCATCGSSRIEWKDAIQSRTNTPERLSGVRDELPTAETAYPLLLEEVQLGQNGAAARQLAGLVQGPEGLHPGSTPRPSDGDETGLCDAAPAGDGGTPGPHTDSGGGRPSPQRDQGRQSDRESGADGSTEARSPTEASDSADRVSALRRHDQGQWACEECGSTDVTPGVVLDPFSGSGTTALVARRLGRKSIGIELNPDYAAMCARRLGQQSLLAEETT